MLSSLFALQLAWADCPAPGPALDDAERDAVAFYLADAQASLLRAAAAFQCSTADRALLGRYWRTQAMIWHVQDDPAAERALAAARRDAPDTFPESLGDDLRARWADTDPAGGPALPLRVRGARRTDLVRVDGVIGAPEAALGLHVVQLERAGVVVGGRVVDVSGPDVEVVFDAGPTDAVGLAAPWPGPPTWTAFGVRDAAGERLRFGRDVLPVALSTAPGREIWPERRRNARLQGLAVTSAVSGTYLLYLLSWDAQTGQNLEPGPAGVGAVTAISLLGTGLVWEGVLIGKRRAQRRGMLEAAATLAP